MTPLLWGCKLVVWILWMPSTLQVSLKNADLKFRPGSVINFHPVPCHVTIRVIYTRAIVSEVISGTENASTYLVKLSINVTKYLTLRGVFTWGPVMSMDVISKGNFGSSTSPSGAVSSWFSFRRWQGSHFQTYSSMDRRIPGNQ